MCSVPIPYSLFLIPYFLFLIYYLLFIVHSLNGILLLKNHTKHRFLAWNGAYLEASAMEAHNLTREAQSYS